MEGRNLRIELAFESDPEPIRARAEVWFASTPDAFRIALKLDETVAMKFLVVDDHELIREAMRGALAELDGDATILEASDSGETMRLIEEHPDVDLILLDLNLPDCDGLTVLSELR